MIPTPQSIHRVAVRPSRALGLRGNSSLNFLLVATLGMLSPCQAWADRLNNSTTLYSGGTTEFSPVVIVGDPNGAPPDSPAMHVDPNVPDSPFAGVVSISIPLFSGGAVLCSGVAIGPRHILTAAHCLDLFGGEDPSGNETGDGVVDVDIDGTVVVFNEDNPASDVAGATLRGVAEAILHPDWNGFLNINAPASEAAPSLNDDIAVLELSTPIPSGIPVYALDDQPFEFITQVTMVGYGETGDGISGTVPGSADFFVKRTGENLASQFLTDDEAPGTAREAYLWDFDGPVGTGVDGLPTLGNEVETTVAPGDSGGPSFIWDDDGDGTIEAEELTVFGINSFGSGNGEFDSLGGGMLVNSYLDFIEAATIPEPSSFAMGVLALGAIGSRRRPLH